MHAGWLCWPPVSGLRRTQLRDGLRQGLRSSSLSARIRVTQRESNPPIHHPSRAARRARPAAYAHAQPALVVARPDQGALRRDRPAGLGRVQATTRSGCSRWSRMSASPSSPRTRISCGGWATRSHELERATGPASAGISCPASPPTARRRSHTSRPNTASPRRLPQYSGGLGILAGDHLKSASDLGVPLIGVGLLYRHGYFTQSLSAEGWQAERYPASDPAGLPIALLRDADGAPARVTVGLPDGNAARRPDLGRRCRPDPAAAARHLHRGQRPAAARGHRPAVRRRQRPPAAPGTAARHRRRAGGPAVLRHHRPPAARGVPHQRGPRRFPRRRADQGVPGRRRVRSPRRSS